MSLSLHQAKDLIEATAKAANDATLVADQTVNVDFKDKEVLSDETRIHRILLLRSWLFHFVGSMHSYFMTRVIHSTELELRSDLANCSDLVTVLKFC